MKRKSNIWSKILGSKDLKAAENYLSLIFGDDQLDGLILALRDAPAVMHDAKDLLRASQTQPLARDNPHVAEDLKRIKKGKALSPVLLIRGNAPEGGLLIIADGYHRICASWYWNENEPVACRIAEFVQARRLRRGKKR